MPIELSCPHCGTRYRLPSEYAGKRVSCKKCGKGFQIPADDEPAPVAQIAPVADVAPPAEQAAKAPRRRSALPIVLILLVLAGGGAAAWWYLQPGRPAGPRDGAPGEPSGPGSLAVRKTPPAFAPLAVEVTKVCAGKGVPGPVTSVDGKGHAILTLGPKGTVATLDDPRNEVKPTDRTFVVAREFGKGRVIAIGHKDVVAAEFRLYDNARFIGNAMAWLDVSDTKTLLIRGTMHSDWLEGLKEYLGEKGWTTRALAPSAALKATDLKGAGVVIYLSRGKPLPAGETGVVRDFVQGGGGLMMTGLGWAWVQHTKDKPLAAFPMNQLAGQFGLKFLGGYLLDRTRNHNRREAHPIFQVASAGGGESPAPPALVPPATAVPGFEPSRILTRTLESFRKAVVANNAPAATALFHQEGPLKDVIGTFMDYVVTASEVGDRMAKAYGDAALQQPVWSAPNRFRKLRDPANWKRVQFTIVGNRARTQGTPTANSMELILVDGVWLIDPSKSFPVPPGQIDAATRQFAKFTRGMKKILPLIGQSGHTPASLEKQLRKAL